MIKMRSHLLLRPIFAYANIFGLLNSESEHLIQVITEKKAVE